MCISGSGGPLACFSEDPDCKPGSVVYFNLILMYHEVNRETLPSHLSPHLEHGSPLNNKPHSRDSDSLRQTQLAVPYAEIN